MARRYFGRISAVLEYTSVLGRQAGFEVETAYAGAALANIALQQVSL
jgi:hypothetical protein